MYNSTFSQNLKKINIIRKLSGQEMNHQINLQVVDIMCLLIHYFSPEEKSINSSFKIRVSLSKAKLFIFQVLFNTYNTTLSQNLKKIKHVKEAGWSRNEPLVLDIMCLLIHYY